MNTSSEPNSPDALPRSHIQKDFSIKTKIPSYRNIVTCHKGREPPKCPPIYNKTQPDREGASRMPSHPPNAPIVTIALSIKSKTTSYRNVVTYYQGSLQDALLQYLRHHSMNKALSGKTEMTS